MFLYSVLRFLVVDIPLDHKLQLLFYMLDYLTQSPKYFEGVYQD